MIYTVDEVSDALGIPRPTLYRYLREYSIPHLRRSGKISIPEESLEGIRAARELHKEGLGTESVRRKLREGDAPGQLTERLDRISEGLEKLRLPDPTEQAPSYQEALEAILEKQDLLISAVTDLSKKMDGLQYTSVPPQATAPDVVHKEFYEPEADVQENHDMERTLVAHGSTVRNTTEETPGTVHAGTNGSANRVAVDEPVEGMFGGRYSGETLSEPMDGLFVPAPREKFGVMARRRKRAVLALLAGLVSVAVLAGWLGIAEEEDVEQPGAGEVAVEEADVPSVAPVTDESKEGNGEVSRTVEVPDLVGLTLPEAEARLVEAGLQRGNLTEATSDVVPVGGVAAQSPLIGARAESGRRVDLVISIGSAEIAPGTSDTDISAYPVDVAPLPVAEAQYPGGVFGSEPFAPVVSPAPVVGWASGLALGWLASGWAGL